jgi:GntR family transcriptional regulator
MVKRMSDGADGPLFDPHGDEFVYVLIARHIADEIDAGVYQTGTPLPAEAVLAAEVYRCAKMTVRRAIEELRGWGYIRTLRGRGNYVRPPGDRRRPTLDDAG